MRIDSKAEPFIDGVITPAEAKRKVLQHWPHLNMLARKHFRKDENLVHEGLLYVLQHLEVNDWQRVRRWQARGEFTPYLTTLVNRALVDFARRTYGDMRKPEWLRAKRHPIWDLAYRLVVVEQWASHEVVEQLNQCFPNIERPLVREIVTYLKSRCLPRCRRGCATSEAVHDHIDEIGEADTTAETLAKAFTEALRGYLREPDDSLPLFEPCVVELRRCLHQIPLDNEDRLLLRLRYRNGLAMSTIVRQLGINGDPYKRLKKLVTLLRETLEQAGYL